MKRPGRLLPLLTLFVFVLVLVLGLWRGSAAEAHSDLIRSEPGYGETLAAVPQPLLLHFDEPVELRAAVTELFRDGRRVAPPHPEHTTADKRTVSVAPTTSGAGDYLFRWFFFGYDGHLMAGELAFTVSPAAAPTVAGGATPVPAPSEAATTAVPPPGRASSRFVPQSVPSEATATAPTALEAFDAAGDLPAGFLARDSSDADTGAAGAGPGTPSPAGFRPGETAGAETAVRVIGFLSLTVLVGGAYLLVATWPEGAALTRARRLLWAALAGSLTVTLLTLGLKGASLRGLTPVSALRPDVIGTVFDTHFGNVLLARGVLLVGAIPLLTMLARKPERTVSSPLWRGSASVVAAGILATHCLTGHAYARGTAATLAAFGHLAGATVWLGGLVMMAVVLLPRDVSEEVQRVAPGFSSLAEKAVALMAFAGAALFVLLEPGWGGLAASGWGQLLLVKLGLVGLILAVARRARSFTRRNLGPGYESGPARAGRRPLTVMVATELALAIGVLAATALLVSRNPPV